MRLITAYQTKNDCYKKAKIMPKGKPEGIVVHSTGSNNTNLSRYVDAPAELGTNKYGNHWNRSGVKKMVHGFIGYDKNKEIAVVNTLPYNYCCWGCGKGSKGTYNYDPAYAQFEICEDDLSNADYFRAVYKAATEYCAYLCKEFGISVSNVISHKEARARGYASNHGDIDHWLAWYGRTMNDFRAEVTKLLEAQTEEEKEEPKEEVKEEPKPEPTEDNTTEGKTDADYINNEAEAQSFIIKLLNAIINFIVDLFSESRK